jgi:hypothetical protein
MNRKMSKMLNRMFAKPEEKARFIRLPHQTKGLVRAAYNADRIRHEESGKMVRHIISLRHAFELAANQSRVKQYGEA